VLPDSPTLVLPDEINVESTVNDDEVPERGLTG
jgi:hypothetical protein